MNGISQKYTSRISKSLRGDGLASDFPLTSNLATESESIEAKLIADQPPTENLAGKGEVPRRKFGRTDVVVSAMALGGATIAAGCNDETAENHD